MEEIKITLETLYDVLRNEKTQEDLQKLNETFFYDVVTYLTEKKQLLANQAGEDDLFAAGEKEKLEYELRSIKRILKETYEKREKKIIDIALNCSRTKSDIIDTSAMLREEKDFYDQLMKLLDGYRNGILMSLFKGELPFSGKTEVGVGLPESPRLVVPEPAVQSPIDTDESERHNESDESNDSDESLESESDESNDSDKSLESESDGSHESTGSDETLGPNPLPGATTTIATAPTAATATASTTTTSAVKDLKKIRFTHPVPSFVWKDLKEYGPFDVGEEAELFPEVVDLMIEKGRGELVV